MKVFILLVLPALALATKGFRQCAAWSADADITGCEENPCKIKSGTLLTGTTIFTARNTIQSPTFEVKLRNGTIFAPYSETNVCKLLIAGQSCPLKKGQSYTVKTALRLGKFRRVGTTDVRFSILDDDFNTVICVAGDLILIP